MFCKLQNFYWQARRAVPLPQQSHLFYCRSPTLIFSTFMYCVNVVGCTTCVVALKTFTIFIVVCRHVRCLQLVPIYFTFSQLYQFLVILQIYFRPSWLVAAVLCSFITVSHLSLLYSWFYHSVHFLRIKTATYDVIYPCFEWLLASAAVGVIIGTTQTDGRGRQLLLLLLLTLLRMMTMMLL